jgi:hypothetical protein
VQPACQNALASWDGQGGRLAEVGEDAEVRITKRPETESPTGTPEPP